jgi:hypothetical protein
MTLYLMLADNLFDKAKKNISKYVLLQHEQKAAGFNVELA